MNSNSLLLLICVATMFTTVFGTIGFIGGATDVSSDATQVLAEIDDYLEDIAGDIIAELEKCGVEFESGCDHVLLVSAKSQHVNGNNYWTKVQLCDIYRAYAHIYFYVPFGGQPELQAIEYPRGQFGDSLQVFYESAIDTPLCNVA
jgi:hypothetical protein